MTRPEHPSTVAGRRTRRVGAVMSLAAVATFWASPGAYADGIELGDQLAAPAVVHIQTTQDYVITFHDMMHGGSTTYPEAVPRPSGMGVIVNPAGLVVTTRSIAYPADAQIEAINRAFSRFHPTRWTPAQLTQRQRVPDTEMNKILQDCYRGGHLCTVTPRGRKRTIALDTVPTAKLILVTGRSVDDAPLTRLNTAPDANTWNRGTVPTVGVATDLAPDATYVALGYDASGGLIRLRGALQGGKVSPADAEMMSTKYINGGDGAVLVDPHSKGEVMAMVVRPPGQAATLQPMGNLLADAGQRVERSTLDGTIDEALGYYATQHYTHAAVLLAQAIKVLPHRELVNNLKTANESKGTDQDKSRTEMDHEAGDAHDAMALPWGWIAAGVGALLLVVALALLFVLRRRAARRSAPLQSGLLEPYENDDDFDLSDSEVDNRGAQASWGGTDAGLDKTTVSSTPRSSPPSTAPPAMQPNSPTTLIPAEANTRATGRAEHYCPQCGAGLLAGDRFCYHCGTPAR